LNVSQLRILEAESIVEADIIEWEEAIAEAEPAVEEAAAAAEEEAPPAIEEVPAAIEEEEAHPAVEEADTGAEFAVNLRVSSKHLILASRYFKTALNGPWTQASSPGCSRSIYANDWDPEAFLILMSIIHGRNQQVPRVIGLELLAKIAVLVDYYDCHEAVEVFAEIWLRELRSQLPAQVGRELVLWLCVSWVFGYAEVFTFVTTTALQQSQEPLPTLGLPITEIIG